MTCRKTSGYSILKDFPTVQVLFIQRAEVFGRNFYENGCQKNY